MTCMTSRPIDLGANMLKTKIILTKATYAKLICSMISYYAVYRLTINGSSEPTLKKFRVQSLDKYLVELKLKLITAFDP